VPGGDERRHVEQEPAQLRQPSLAVELSARRFDRMHDAAIPAPKAAAVVLERPFRAQSRHRLHAVAVVLVDRPQARADRGFDRVEPEQPRARSIAGDEHASGRET